MAELKKLRECPFCGGEAEHEIFNDGFFTLGRVECKQCKAMLTTPPVITINAWNNRPAEAEIRAKAHQEFYDKVLNFEDYIGPIAELDGVQLYSGRDITRMVRKIAEELKKRE